MASRATATRKLQPFLAIYATKIRLPAGFRQGDLDPGVLASIGSLGQTARMPRPRDANRVVDAFHTESPKENPMRHISLASGIVLTAATVAWFAFPLSASAELKAGWDGKRHISYQQQKDLFYNYYAQPGPCNGAAAQMYVSPRPVPPRVGHTWVTYQPLMPHEFLHKHKRSYYTHTPGAGWRRTNVRYGTCGLRCQDWCAETHFPMSNNIWALHNDFYYPGLRF